MNLQDRDVMYLIAIKHLIAHTLNELGKLDLEGDPVDVYNAINLELATRGIISTTAGVAVKVVPPMIVANFGEVRQ